MGAFFLRKSTSSGATGVADDDDVSRVDEMSGTSGINPAAETRPEVVSYRWYAEWKSLPATASYTVA
jgi:hypothetical protein